MSIQNKLFDDKSTYSEKRYDDQYSWSKAVKERDNYTCQYSLDDKYRKHDGSLEAHHIFPKKYGGKNVISNGITLCKHCHAQFLIEAEQKYYSLSLKKFYLQIKDLVTGLFGQPHQLRYYVLLDYLTSAKSFREKQLEAIKVVVEKHKNLVFVSPTGSGKSLIYQMIGILSQDQTLVISPLMALQKDQVESLWKKWVPSTLINSSIPIDEKKRRVANVLTKSYSFVFAHPKQFLSKNEYSEKIELKTNNILMQANFGTLCVDEAHVIDNWGKQFIEEYAELLQLRKHFKVSKTILLSASLTKKMQNNIVKNLFNEDEKPEVIVTGFYRPEIRLFVEKFNPFNLYNENRLTFLNRLLKESEDKKAIVFCTTSNQVEEVTMYLELRGHNVKGFYSKLDTEVKKEIQNRFSGKGGKGIDVLVCTSAFGMGINISNIHLAIHYSLPFSLNDYYQQFGRIGRDGQSSRAYLLYDKYESSKLISYIEGKQLEGIVDLEKKKLIVKSFAEDTLDLMNYIESVDKWKFILNYFGDMEPITSRGGVMRIIKRILIFLAIILFISLLGSL